MKDTEQAFWQETVYDLATSILSLMAEKSPSEAATVAGIELASAMMHARSLLRPVVAQAEREASMSQQETRVVVLLGLGYSDRQIASRMRISQQVLKTHMRHILRKLRVHRNAETHMFCEALERRIARAA